MFVYIALFVYLLFLIIKFDFAGRHPHCSKEADTHIKVVEVLFILIVGFSYRIGIDCAVYMDSFPLYPKFSEFSFKSLPDYQFEPFWTLLNVIGRSTFDNFVFINLFCATLINVVIFKIFKQECAYPFSAILLYYLLGWINVSFEMLRQTCATAFYLWGCIALLKGDKKSFVIRSLPAVFFHVSGVLLILITFGISFIKTNKFTIIAFIAIFFIGLGVKEFLPNFIAIIDRLSMDVGDKYSFYLDQSTSSKSNFFGIMEDFVLHVFLPAIVVFYYQKKKENIFFISLLLTYMLFSSLISTLGIFYRLALSLQFFFYIGFVNMIYDMFKARNNILVRIALLCLMLYNVDRVCGSLVMGRQERFSYNGKDVRYFPYNSIFNKENIPERESVYEGNVSIYKLW